MPAADHNKMLHELLSAAQGRWCDPVVGAIVTELCERHSANGSPLHSVIFYGSRLFSGTATSTSFYDFYVIVEQLWAYHRKVFQTLLNTVLPPNVYFGRATRAQHQPRYKVCVLSRRQFLRETTVNARDIHHLGRFSKRFMVAHARDDQARNEVFQGAINAMSALVPYSLTLLPARFELDQFIRQQMAISYLGEQRVSEPTKVAGLLDGQLDYYRALYRQVLAIHCARGGLRSDAPDSYLQQERAPTQRHDQKRTQAFLRRSRRRGLLRWPKYVLTVEDWLQIQLEKLERNHDVELNLSKWQRRYPLLFGWPKFFELKRKGIIR